MRLPETLPLLCDLDGTLIDSTASVIAAFQWWAEQRGLPDDTASRIPFGRTSPDGVRILAPDLDAVVEGDLLDARQASHTAGVVAFAGAADLLRRHRRLAIVTSCPRELADARLRAAGLLRPAIVLTSECWEHGKPGPEPYLLGAEALGAEPAECVVLEDAPAGVASGVAAGARVLALLTTHRRDQLPGATAYLDALTDLPECVRALGL